MEEHHNTFSGHHKEGFRAATEAAVKDFESKNGGPPKEPVTLRVVDMYVSFHNPIHDYHVVLGPSS